MQTRKRLAFVASSNLSMSGTLTCEAGCVVDDETGGQKPPSEPRASCPSLSSDGHGSCKPRVPHLTPFLLQSPSLSFPPWRPPPRGPPTSPSTLPTPMSGSQTSAPRTSPAPPTARDLGKLIEFSRFPFQYNSVRRQEGSAHKACRFRASLAKGHPIRFPLLHILRQDQSLRRLSGTRQACR